MKPSIQYRRFKEKDIPDLVDVVIKNWKYDEKLESNQARSAALAFLYYALANMAYSKVAEVDGKAIGIIIGNRGDIPPRTKLFILKAVFYGIPLFFSKKGREMLSLYYKTVRTNNKLFKKLSTSFDGEVALFAVGEEAQGLGIGSSLFHFFLRYLEKHEDNRFFLYTDTSCNYGFYEHKGLKRIAEEVVKIGDPSDEEMRFFIYKGEREKLLEKAK